MEILNNEENKIMIEIDPNEALLENEVDALMHKMNIQNEKILEDFKLHLKESGLAPKTIDRHVGNIEFYINTYLLYYDIEGPHQGHYRLDDFLGNFFPAKAMWSSPATVKENITSLKKFYKYLHELSLVSDEDLASMHTVIKEEKENWISLYDDEG